MKLINKYKTILLYLLSSLLSFLIDIIVFSLLVYTFNKSIIVSSFIARFISCLFNFYVNKKLVFNSSKSIKSLLEYFILVIINITISSLLVNKLYSLITINVTIIKVIIDTLIFIVNYFLQKLVIFT